MINERVIWTALPRGWNDNRQLVLSLFVSPRLCNGGDPDAMLNLDDFSSFENWPESLQAIKFRVEFDNGLEAESVVAKQADPELWALLFPPDTPVRPYVFQDHAQRAIHTYPVRDIHHFLQNVYGSLGASGEEVPSIDDPSGPLVLFEPLEQITSLFAFPMSVPSFYDEWNRAGAPGEDRQGMVVSEYAPGDGLDQQQQAVQDDFYQAYRFYNRPGSRRPEMEPKFTEPYPDEPEFDFHEMVALLGDHPEILRRLGLVIDLVVDLADPLANLPPTGTVRVVPLGELPEDPPLTLATRYELDEALWGAAPEDPNHLARGLLHLHEELYELFQVDVDGGVMQATGFADTLSRLRDPDTRGPDTPSEAAAPALRSAGLTLARNYRAYELLKRLQRQRRNNDDIESGSDVILFAEDLLRGYRVDIFDKNAAGGARWFSLHQRICNHTIDETGDVGQPLDLPPIEDEGFIKATSAASERKDRPDEMPPSDDLYLHEALFGWQGWSLSTPFPGKRVVEPGAGDGDSSIESYDPLSHNPFRLITDVKVAPGTLPRLRVGHTYRMRARTVDLAGNSRPFSREDLEPDELELASEAETFLRFEPVPSPTVLRRYRDTEGESLEHLVIRSNIGQSAKKYAAALEKARPGHGQDPFPFYFKDSQRHLAAPKGSLQMAEQHEKLESAFGGGEPEINEVLRMALREEGTFLDEHIVDLDSGKKTIDQTEITLHPQESDMPQKRGDPLDQGVYAFYQEDHVILPYLPDPLAIGFSLTGHNFKGKEVFHLHDLWPAQLSDLPIDLVSDFLAGEWPDFTPIRLRLKGVNAEINGGKVKRADPVFAFVKGVLKVTLAQGDEITGRLSSIFPKDRLTHMAMWQWMEENAKSENMERLIADGRHWMFTPFRLLTFTHAVQQPLLVPNMSKVTWQREVGSTYATAMGSITNDAKSTGRLDIYGEWTEDIDLLTDDEPRMRALESEEKHATHVFGFDIDPCEDNAQVTIGDQDQRLSRHEFGDTKHRRILYHSVATTRYREFFPESIAADLSLIQQVEASKDGDGEEIASLVRHIPSSTRPAAPQVKYVLPTFRWERDDESVVRRHDRFGKAVRVWMDRPWFSSGDDEKLAVILAPGVKYPPGWRPIHEDLELSTSELSRRAPFVSHTPLRANIEEAMADSKMDRLPSRAQFSASESPFAAVIEALGPLYNEEALKAKLRPYVTNWGSDPVWASERSDAPPSIAAFPLHTGYASGLSLEELDSYIKVIAVVHDVHFDREERNLWYCDIEIDPGDTYYPFVRLALARYQPYSVNDVHLSRVTMTDFIQLAPDRTTELKWIDRGTVQIKVEGYSGRNIVDRDAYLLRHLPVAPSEEPNTMVRAVLQRRNPDIPGDLGWEASGDEITLKAESSGFFVTWTGELPVSRRALARDEYRILVSEIETYDRDLNFSTDPPYSVTPHDFLRERVVFADIFELWTQDNRD